MRKTYRLSSWRGWDRTIDRCAQDFTAEFGRAPNLLVASGVTLRRMNVAADKARIGDGRGARPPGDRYVELRGFLGRGYELVFVEEEGVPENAFALIHAYGSEDEADAAAMR